MFIQLEKYKQFTSAAAFWVTLSLLAALIPHFQRLPIWMIIVVMAAFSWRLYGIKNTQSLPNKWLLFLLSVFILIATISHFGTILGKTAGTAFLSVLLSIKLLESHNKRDYMLLIGLSFFIISTNFLFSQSIPTVTYLFFSVFIITISMLSINIENLQMKLMDRVTIAGRLILQALPLMLILFFLFPRIPGPLWKLPGDTATAHSGLSDSMSPGNISQLIQSSDVAFRVEFKENIPPQNKLYWRAMVFWKFDGRTWSKEEPNTTPTLSIDSIKQASEYTITAEPHEKRFLFTLDMPVYLPDDVLFNTDFLLLSTHKIDSLYQYTVTSFLDYRIQNTLPSWESSAGLKLPSLTNPKTVALGKKWKSTLQSPAVIIKKALNHFNKNLFIYTLKPPLTSSTNPVDEFLFETRKGFCEHYASSFTLLMRAAGIPARVVIGYQGGEINPINNFLTVRQSDAHAWTEVWLKDQGWVRVDPTSAVAPERIEGNLNSALNSGEYRPFHMYLSNGPLKQLNFYWDAIDNSWKQWIIAYDSELQHQILSTIFNKKMSFYDVAIVLLIVLFSATAIITLYILRSTFKTSINPVQKIYNTFCNKLSKKGLTRGISEGPMDFCIRAIEKFPEQKEAIELITKLYINIKFKSKTDDRLLKKLKQKVGSLRPG